MRAQELCKGGFACTKGILENSSCTDPSIAVPSIKLSILIRKLHACSLPRRFRPTFHESCVMWSTITSGMKTTSI